jgi:uncharacterized protein
MTVARTAGQIVELLELHPHPEGGFYRETWLGPMVGGRASGTSIYYLLTESESSRWHRIDAAEIWHHYAGAALELSTWTDGRAVEQRVLGSDLASGDRPQLVVPPDAWQSARSLGPWTLVGCTVSPGFEFDRFELAPPDWRPPS